MSLERKPSHPPLSLASALSKAKQELPRLDPAVVAGKTYAEFYPAGPGAGQFQLPYFGERYIVDFPSGNVFLASEEAASAPERTAIPAITQVLLLHYLESATGVDLTGRWVSYHELPQGTTYERAFHQRAIAPLEVSFGFDVGGFITAGLAAGGERARLGDASFFFRVLPRISLMCVIWAGDEDVPPGANILFDAAAGAYLPGEDLAYLGIALTARMLGAKRGALLT